MNATDKHRLYLIPNMLSEANSADFFSAEVKQRIHHLKHFIVEQEKPARALLKRLGIATPQSEIYLRLWNEHSNREDLRYAVELFKSGDVGLISDAGIPCVADPGADIVSWAHRKGVQVIPLPGASSIFMALMASGFNGQSFTFHGYLPIDKVKRVQKIKEICADAMQKNQSQIFIEAPYRNNQLLQDVLKSASKGTMLCIACAIGSAEEFIFTQPIGEWEKNIPELHKKPVVFIIG